MGRDRKLFWQVMAPLAVTFALLWLGTVSLFTQWTCQRMEQRVDTACRDARDELERQWEIYQNNLNNGLGAAPPPCIWAIWTGVWPLWCGMRRGR